MLSTHPKSTTTARANTNLTNEIKYIYMTEREPSGASHTVIGFKYQSGEEPLREEIHTPVEKDVLLTVNGEEWLTFMCTPLQLDELGVGFLFNEGIIHSLKEIESYRVCKNDLIDIWLSHPASKPEKWSRTSGCHGGRSASNAANPLLIPPTNATLTPASINDLMKMLLESQKIYRHTRGVHGSALSDGQSILFSSEDIGRHNTFDKLAGAYLLSGKTIPHPLVLTTGRVSSEMIQKATKLRSQWVISLSSPTSKSVEFAQQAGVTLVGYARRNSFIVYSHRERISSTQSNPPGEIIPQSSWQDFQR